MAPMMQGMSYDAALAKTLDSQLVNAAGQQITNVDLQFQVCSTKQMRPRRLYYFVLELLSCMGASRPSHLLGSTCRSVACSQAQHGNEQHLVVQDQNRKGLPPLQRPASSRSGGWRHKQLLLGVLAIVALSLLPLMAITADTYNRVVKMYNIGVRSRAAPSLRMSGSTANADRRHVCAGTTRQPRPRMDESAGRIYDGAQNYLWHWDYRRYDSPGCRRALQPNRTNERCVTARVFRRLVARWGSAQCECNSVSGWQCPAMRTSVAAGAGLGRRQGACPMAEAVLRLGTMIHSRKHLSKTNGVL